ncbi:MAG: glycosyltransferase family 4 protein [Acidobacteriota bacterium]
MRILVLADIRFPLERANGVQTIETCHALARRGHDVRLVVRPDTFRPPRDPLTYYGLPPVASLRIEAPSLPATPAWRRPAYLLRIVRRSATAAEADVIVTRDLTIARVLLALRAVVRVPVVYESHGYAPVVSAEMPSLVSTATAPTRTKLARLARRERYVWRHAAGYVTITEGLRLELESRFGPRSSVAVVPDGARVPANATVAREMSTPPVVGYAGHLYPWKGLDVFLLALARLEAIRGLVIGGLAGEPDLDRVRTMAEKLAPGRVTFAGAVPPGEVAPLLRAADVLMLPNPATRISSSYTSPLKLFEYMASGRPIVASDLPALREVLRDGQNALLVEPGNPSRFADAILRIVRDAALARRLASAALAEVTNFTWDRRADRLERLFSPLARRGAVGGSRS